MLDLFGRELFRVTLWSTNGGHGARSRICERRKEMKRYLTLCVLLCSLMVLGNTLEAQETPLGIPPHIVK